MAEAPDEFQCYLFCFRLSRIDLFPAEMHGQPVLDFVMVHHDPTAVDFVRPLQELGERAESWPPREEPMRARSI